jgi:hypothetical protein
MSPSINLSEDLYQRLGRYGSRDESWDDVVARVLEHVNDDEAFEDKRKRRTTYRQGNETVGTSDKGAGNPVLQQLENGATVRHQYQRGNYSGNEVEARVVDGHVEYDGEKFTSPSPAARKADQSVRGEDAASSLNGWDWWEYKNENGRWVPIDRLRD